MDKLLQLGPEAQAEMKIADGKVVLSLNYVGKQATGSASLSLDVEQFAQMLKDAIPGTIDDAIIDVLIAAMKVV